MSKGISVKDFAGMINRECEEYNYLFALGLVKETLPLWKNPVNKELLCETAQMMAEHYLEEAMV